MYKIKNKKREVDFFFERKAIISNGSVIKIKIIIIIIVGTQAQIYIGPWALFEEAQWSENRSIVRKK